MLKVIIYDLDDTIYDCSGKVTKLALENVASVLSEKYPNLNKDKILADILDIYDIQGPKTKVFEVLADVYQVPNKEEFVSLAKKAYDYDFVPDIKPFEDVETTINQLKSKGLKVILLTFGKEGRQKNKINKLKIKHLFDDIFITNQPEKETAFQQILSKYNVKPNEVLVIGDKIFAEIKIANQMGMTTVQYKHGRFKDVLPENKYEYPDYKINKHLQLLGIVDTILSSSFHNPAVVVIGGGTGLPRVLEALKKYTKNITGIVTVTDSGRSSGILRRDYGIPAVGDLRNCLIALSDSSIVAQLLQYRFLNGSLEGHSFGNLFLTALSDILGGLEQAIERASEILNIRGKVVPSTYDSAHVCAELEDGTTYSKEVEIVVRQNFEIPIKKVWLSPKAKASKKALEAIESADLIVIGPGSWYTSVISNLLVEGIPDAINKSKAKKIIITNIMSQACQTHNYKLSDYLKTILKYLDIEKVDCAIYNTKIPEKRLLEAYEKEHSYMVENDVEEAKKYAKLVIGKDLVEDLDKKRTHWKKQDWLRHDPDKLAKTILSVL